MGRNKRFSISLLALLMINAVSVILCNSSTAAPIERTFNTLVTKDAAVWLTDPNTNYGTGNYTAVSRNYSWPIDELNPPTYPSPLVTRVYLFFQPDWRNPTGMIPSDYTDAELALYPYWIHGSAELRVNQTISTWSETGITWNTQPTPGALVGQSLLTANWTFVHLNVTSLMQFGQNFSVCLSIAPSFAGTFTVGTHETDTYYRPMIVWHYWEEVNPAVDGYTTSLVITAMLFGIAALLAGSRRSRRERGMQ